MSNPVLCAVDIANGDDDVKTLQVAARMAALENTTLDVVAVTPDFGLSQVSTFFEDHHHEAMVEHAKEELNTLVTRALDADQNSKARHVVATGRAYEQVLKLANEIKPSLIVIGAHKSDLADYLLGPNAARIVRHSSCSVYVVR